MTDFDCIVIGAGVSGLVFAARMARGGQRTLVLESAGRVGGCIRTWRLHEDFWLELGAHTAYNSYAPLLEALSERGRLDQLQLRRKLGYRFVTPHHSLQSPLARLNFFQAAVSFPFGIARSKSGRSVADWFAGLLGRDNYRNLLAPAFAAVLSQQADDFPAEWLFRSKPRMKQAPRSYTFADGLQGLLEAIVSDAAFSLRTDARVSAVQRNDSGFVVTMGDESLTCRRLALATPIDTAVELLRPFELALATQLADIAVIEIESLGVVVPAASCRLPPLAGLMAVDDAFWSVVSRDVVPHPNLRGFTFHFRPGRLDRAGKLARAAEVLGVAPEDFIQVAEAANHLPAPRVRDVALAKDITRQLAGESFTLIGNYLNGLSIGDCAELAAREATRLLRG
jgi:protoporphyrinogen/coproporphyrinogen III oxidase